MIDAFPAWTMVAWALGVWGALVGSVLLLARSRFAVHAFGVSLAGLAASTAYQQTVDMPESMTGGMMMVMNLIIWAGAILLLGYAWGQRKSGVLR